MADLDFDGCSSSACRPRNKPWVHTFEWGLCAHAEEPPPDPPVLGRWETYTADDGYPAVRFAEVEVESRTEWGLREDGGDSWPPMLDEHWAREFAKDGRRVVRRTVYYGPAEEVS